MINILKLTENKISMNPYFNHCIIFCSLGPEKDQLNRYNKPSDAQVKQINDTLSKLKVLCLQILMLLETFQTKLIIIIFPILGD